MAEAPQPGPAAALRLIRDRNFGPYFFGNASSATGTWFQNLAASLLVYRLTHSAFLLGVLNFGNFVPVLLLAPWAGSSADRFDRRRPADRLDLRRIKQRRCMAGHRDLKGLRTGGGHAREGLGQQDVAGFAADDQARHADAVP